MHNFKFSNRILHETLCTAWLFLHTIVFVRFRFKYVMHVVPILLLDIWVNSSFCLTPEIYPQCSCTYILGTRVCIIILDVYIWVALLGLRKCMGIVCGKKSFLVLCQPVVDSSFVNIFWLPFRKRLNTNILFLMQ